MLNKYYFVLHEKDKRNFDMLYFSILTTLMEAIPPVHEINISGEESLQLVLNFLVSVLMFVNNV